MNAPYSASEAEDIVCRSYAQHIRDGLGHADALDAAATFYNVPRFKAAGILNRRDAATGFFAHQRALDAEDAERREFA